MAASGGRGGLPVTIAPEPRPLPPPQVTTAPQPDADPREEDALTPAVCVASDLTETGRSGVRWLVVADGIVRILAPDAASAAPSRPNEARLDEGHLWLSDPPPQGTSCVLQVPLEEIRDCEVASHVGSGTLVAQTAAGPRILLRFSSALASDFGLAARAVAALAKGEAIAIDPRDLPRYCPRCQRRLGVNTRVCPSCVHRGAVLRRLLAYAQPYRFHMAAAAGLMLVGTLLDVLPPKIAQWITDGLIYGHWPGWTGRGVAALGVLTAVLLLTRTVGLGLNVARTRIGVWVGNRAMGDIRSALWGGIQGLSLSYFDKSQVGQILTRVTEDTQRMQSFLTDGAQYFITEVLQLVFVVVMMLSISWKLTLIVLIPAPLMYGISVVAWPRLRRSYRQLRSIVGRLNVVVNDVLTGIRVVKAFGQEPREVAHFNGISQQLVRQSVTTDSLWATVFPIFGFVAGLGGILIWYAGGLLVLHHSVPFGDIVAFTGYIGMLLGPLQWMSQLFSWMANSLTSAERVFEVMDTETDVVEAVDAQPVETLAGRVALRDVRFGYAPHLPVLHGVNLEVPAGEMVGLVGHSGAGKSTLINLICRLYDPDQGTIEVDGTDLRHMRQSDLRRHFGVVLQDTFLFDGTIADNIAYARPDAGHEDILRAAQIANAHEFTVQLADGYDTRVGERGTRLSGGERQRIAIARAVLHDPRILILDEATASVDTQTERQIQEAIARLIRGRTTFAIAHRLSTLRNANRLVVLDHGKVAEVGTHTELMERNGIYAGMVRTQQENAAMTAEAGIGA